ncbi:MAG: phospholipase D-like domain-containing protein [Acidobacteriota bacterium]
MTRAITIPLWVLALLIFTILVLGLIVWSVKRRRRPKLEQTSGDSDSLLPTMAGLLQSTIVGGNAVELLQNGAFFDRLFADLEAAQSTINIETFLCKEGEVTRRLTDLLLAKRKEGVEVRVLVDGSGGKGYGKSDVKRLRDAGCPVRKFHPIRISNLGRLNQRTHRKIVIIDGRIGYVGGHCLVDTWLGDAEDKQHFRDISARVEGPVVNQIQSAFTDNWIEETGEVIAGEKFFPELEDAGPSDAQIVFISPTGGPSTLKLLHHVAINEAKKSITIQNPYFLPDPDACQALLEAVKRGVEVRVMIPDTAATDAKLVSHASHHHYGTLLKGGVRVFDYQHTLLHQKVFTVDHAWSSIGSTNFDDRSFEINDEISLVVYDKAIARELEKTFTADAKLSKERSLEEWKKRPVGHKLVDGSAFLVNEQL